MLKVGDTVKVISKTMCSGIETELIPIGTICAVVGVCGTENPYCEILPIFPRNSRHTHYYLENELEKGELVWVPSNKKYKIETSNHTHIEYFDSYDKAVKYGEKISIETRKEVTLFEYINGYKPINSIWIV